MILFAIMFPQQISLYTISKEQFFFQRTSIPSTVQVHMYVHLYILPIPGNISFGAVCSIRLLQTPRSQDTTHFPDRQAIHFQDRQALHFPDRQALHFPDRQAIHFPEKRAIHFPDRPAIHFPVRQAIHFPDREDLDHKKLRTITWQYIRYCCVLRNIMQFSSEYLLFREGYCYQQFFVKISPTICLRSNLFGGAAWSYWVIRLWSEISE